MLKTPSWTIADNGDAVLTADQGYMFGDTKHRFELPADSNELCIPVVLRDRTTINSPTCRSISRPDFHVPPTGGHLDAHDRRRGQAATLPTAPASREDGDLFGFHPAAVAGLGYAGYVWNVATATSLSGADPIFTQSGTRLTAARQPSVAHRDPNACTGPGTHDGFKVVLATEPDEIRVPMNDPDTLVGGRPCRRTRTSSASCRPDLIENGTATYATPHNVPDCVVVATPVAPTVSQAECNGPGTASDPVITPGETEGITYTVTEGTG